MQIILKNSRLFKCIGYLCLALILKGCDDNALASTEEELFRLNNELTALATSVDCTNSSDWSVTAIGSKACGGPTGYIAYPKQIDTIAFLEKVQEYTEVQNRYNQENDIISDCAVEPAPFGLICRDNLAELIYNPCELIPDSGPCEAAITRYYFNQETQECEEFLWGGCDGVVPFETLEACQLCE